MWHKELGFTAYPLDPRSNPDLVGVDEIQDKIEQFILQGNMCLISGFTGSGKTSMLNRLTKSEALQEFRFVFISADGIRNDYDIHHAIADQSNILDRLLRKKPKNLIVLLDECHMSSRVLTESIKSLWNVQYPDGTRAIHSVILSQIEDRLGTNFSGSFADRLGQRVLVMPKLDHDQLYKVLEKRLQTKQRNYMHVFSDDALHLLTQSADGSVRQLLEYTDAVFAHHHAIEGDNPILGDDYTVSKEAVFNILQASGLVALDRMGKKESFRALHEDEQLKLAVDMFLQFGALSAVDLAEKLNVDFEDSSSRVNTLKTMEAVLFAYADDGRDYFVLSPRLQHELTRA